MTSCLRTLTYLRHTALRNVSIKSRVLEKLGNSPRNCSTVGTTEEVLRLSQSAINRLKALNEDDGTFLRVMVEGGGCSGFQTKFEFDSKIKEDDILVEKEGVKIVVDNDSLEFIRGSTIDFHEELIRSAFAVVNNPHAEQGCSCGASFSMKL